MKAPFRGLAGLAALLLAPTVALAQAPPPIPQPAAPPLPVQPSVQYFYNHDGKPTGPVTLGELRRKLASGEISPETLVWKTGMPAWAAAKTVPELTVAAVPKPAPAPNPGPGPVVQPVTAQGGCSGHRVYLSDTFAKSPVDGPQYSVEEGKLKSKAPSGRTSWFLYGSTLNLTNYEVCVIAQLPNKFQSSNLVVGGLIFLAKSVDDYYTLVIAANGQAAVQHYHDQKIDLPGPWKESDAIKLDAPGKNMLHVVVRGDSAATFINGQAFATVSVEAPKGAKRVGLMFHSENAQRDTWKFIDFKATDAP